MELLRVMGDIVGPATSKNEKDTLELMTEIIAKEKIDCDFWRGFTHEIAIGQPTVDNLAAAYQEFLDDGGPVDGIERILDQEQARRETRCHTTIAAYKSPAGALWPYKLVAHLLKLCIEKYGLNLQTHTPIREVISSKSGWTVKTDRGDVNTEKVVYATNAFTGTLLPEFIGHIWPFKGQCSVVVPPANSAKYSGKNMLTATYHLDDREYLHQRPKDGIIVYGGGRRVDAGRKLRGNTDDSYFEGLEGEVLSEGMIHIWSGIMGYTKEAVPYVGELYEKPGAFICAGHHGHGMARIMTCAKGLAALIQGSSWDSTRLPECFQPTRERLAAEI
ncbi:FAD dependent oxidoreductase [Mycena crocata]|nr:FAD dependent oxidoreductase [Mycena crocata]